MALYTPETSHVMPSSLPAQEWLNEQAQFSLEGHQLVDPDLDRGYVSSVTELPAVSMAGEPLPEGVRLFDIETVDPFVEADPEGYKIVRNHVEKLEGLIRGAGFDPLKERQEDHPYMPVAGTGEVDAHDENRGNIFTEAWLAGENLRPLKAWRSHVPTAEALGYLTDPSMGSTILDKKSGSIYVSNPETAAHLRFVDDAVAIRDRAVAMEYIAYDGLLKKTNETDPETLRWLSLASGTGEPSIAACKKIEDIHGKDVELIVTDINKQSLKFVQSLVQKYGYESGVITLATNILGEEFVEELIQATGSRDLYDWVEFLGFGEYLPRKGDDLGAYKKMDLPQVGDFTRMAYDFVKPGGRLIAGNMVLDRPQRDFVFGVVDWTIINARTEESIVGIFQDAGIPMSQIKMYRVRNKTTGSHLYNIVEVTKPLDEEATTETRIGAGALALSK